MGIRQTSWLTNDTIEEVRRSKRSSCVHPKPVSWRNDGDRYLRLQDELSDSKLFHLGQCDWVLAIPEAAIQIRFETFIFGLINGELGDS